MLFPFLCTSNQVQSYQALIEPVVHNDAGNRTSD